MHIIKTGEPVHRVKGDRLQAGQVYFHEGWNCYYIADGHGFITHLGTGYRVSVVTSADYVCIPNAAVHIG